jgi:hypothetical protein
MSNTSTFTLDKKTKKEWVKALRSGEFKQTKSVLYNREDNGYCCLGVLCVLEGENEKQLNGKGFPFSAKIGEKLTSDELEELLGGDAFEKLCGFGGQYDSDEMTYAVKIPGTGWIPLSHLNDNKNYSFAKIADIVEKYVETH